MNNSSNRKLAAILFADIVSYTSLMQSNEQMALQTIQNYQSILSSSAQQYNGQVLKNYGDGSLVIFQNSLEAVQAAKVIQEQCIGDVNIPLRIGIHVGEFVVRDKDIYGNGVNLAARLESLGVAGSVLFSKEVYRKIKNHPELQLRSLGRFQFKNVEEPMEVFALANEGFPVPEKEYLQKQSKLSSSQKGKNQLAKYWPILLLILAGAFWYFNKSQTSEVPEAGINSIGVMPFQNLSGNDQLNYFSTALREELTTRLIHVKALDVFSSEVLNQFDAAKFSLVDFGQRKQIEHLLTGSIRVDEQQNRIVDTKLLHAPSGKYLWAQSFKESELPIAAFQNEIAKKVVESLSLELSLKETEGLNQRLTESEEAYELYLKANQYFSWNGDSIRKHAVLPLIKCIELDPNFAQAYASLAEHYFAIAEWGLEEPLPLQREAKKYINQAFAIAPEDKGILNTLAQIQTSFDWDFQAAELSFQKALEIEPRDINDYIFYLLKTGQKAKALQVFQTTLQNFPEMEENNRYPLMLAWLFDQNGQFDKSNEIYASFQDGYLEQVIGVNLFFVSEHFGFQRKREEALEYYDKTWSHNPTLLHGFKAYQLAKLGRKEEAEMEKVKLLALDEEKYISPVAYSMIEHGLGNVDKSIDQLEQAYANNDSWILMHWVFSAFQDEALKNNPRYQDLLNKIGLSVEE